MAGNTTGLINGGGMALAAGRSAVGDSAPAFLRPGFGMSQIERRLIPVGGIVARSAVCSQCSRMEVRVGMAGDTGSIQSLELPTRMAFLTADLGVCARQRELGPIVVKGCVFPIIRGVTTATVRAKFAVVFVVLLVAGITICGRARKDIILMATFAGRFRMFAFEFESRKVVIELRGFPAVG